MEQQQKDNNKINIEYPEVVHDHKDSLKNHNSQHKKVQQPDVIFNEEEEGNQKQNKPLPHLKFTDQGKDNITMGSLGVRDQRTSIQPIFDSEQNKPRQSVLQEEECEDDEQQNQKRLPHIDFHQKEKKSNIAFVGKKLDTLSPKHNSTGSINSYGSLGKIQENEEEPKANTFALSPSQQKEFKKFHQNLQKIDQEIQILEKEDKVSPAGKFKRQKSIENDIKESIAERDDEAIEEEENQKNQHKQNALGQGLKKLEQSIENGLDEAELINRQRVGSEIKQNYEEAIDEKDELEEEKQQQ